MNKTVLITGATSGLGLEFSKIFSKNGYNLVIVGRNKEKLKLIKKHLKKLYNIQIYAMSIDLTKDKSAHKIFNFLKENKINVDILVNNAGFGDFGEFANSNLQKQINMLNLNITSLVKLSYLFINSTNKHNDKKILNIASIAGFQSGPLMSVYYATKAFVLSFSDALQFELKNKNISVTTLCPGPVKTKFECNANLKSSGLFKNIKPMDAKDVAIFGYNALMKNKSVVIAGKINNVVVLCSKLLPRKFIKNMVYLIQK